jgi:DNA (cytosine-5)-methyltransferase 1
MAKQHKIETLKFIDLFAGLGGFHKALEDLGCKCVFASELKEDLKDLYILNFGMKPKGDITKEDPKSIPDHDILCAGFPCQPFSQAGKQEGFNDTKMRGNLFDNICDILREKHPRYVMLENVSNLKGHDHGNTWKIIHQKLCDLNYHVYDPQILSPHQWGIPQHRRRIYIVCEHNDYWKEGNFEYPKPTKRKCDIKKIIKPLDTDFLPLKNTTRHQLDIWEEFIKQTIAHGQKIPRFPIWAMEFGADYDFEDDAPCMQTLAELRGKRGHLGKEIYGSTIDECLKGLPIYSQSKPKKTTDFPKWKKTYIRKNREFHLLNKEWLDPWIEKVKGWENSHLKFEWNCGDDAEPTLHDKIIQFRASGIRVKLPTYSPALNLVGSQIPIFPWVKLPEDTLKDGGQNEGRYMTRNEAAVLQGMSGLKFDGLSMPRSFEALGNAVNVDIVKRIAINLLKNG